MPCLSRGPDDKSNDDIPARRGERPAATTRMTTTALLFPQWCQPSGAMTQPGQEPESRAGRTSRDDSPGGRSNGARARQAGEHVRVGVGVQLFGDLVGQHVDLLDERAQRCQQRPGHMCSRDAGVAGAASWAAGSSWLMRPPRIGRRLDSRRETGWEQAMPGVVDVVAALGVAAVNGGAGVL